jgi:hypothetical protein
LTVQISFTVLPLVKHTIGLLVAATQLLLTADKQWL